MYIIRSSVERVPFESDKVFEYLIMTNTQSREGITLNDFCFLNLVLLLNSLRGFDLISIGVFLIKNSSVALGVQRQGNDAKTNDAC